MFTIWTRPIHLQSKIDDQTILFTFDGEEHTQQAIDENVEI